MKKTVLLGGGAVALVAAAGALWLAGKTPDAGMTPISLSASAQETAPAATTTSSVASRVPDMVMGKIDAPVTVVEYASFTCPHCANFHATVWNEFKKNYIDTGKVKFVYREVYFDKFGLWAAIVARCGGPEKYFGISDILYDHQKDWLASNDEKGIADALKKIGLSAGMTEDQVNACLNDNDQAKAMVTAYQTNATNDNVQGTPTFLINGESHSGEMTYAEFAALLDAKLKN
ncbi:MAG: DsbA family protein [Paracoccaceae bacterium]